MADSCCHSSLCAIVTHFAAEVFVLSIELKAIMCSVLHFVAKFVKIVPAIYGLLWLTLTTYQNNVLKYLQAWQDM